VLAVATLVFVGGRSSVANAQDARPCQPPDSTAAALKRLATVIAADTSQFARTIRSSYGIPIGTPGDVMLVQDNAICDAATAGIDAEAGRRLPDALVVVRMGETTPFYLLTRSPTLAATPAVTSTTGWCCAPLVSK
jgi:hypothetical protein